MESPIAISVVVPAYNEETLISKCLRSLTDQNFNLHYEIIVVDNNSTDKTYKIAQKFKVTIVKENCQNVVAARQKGLVTAQGEIIAGADCDATYPTDWLRKLYDSFTKNPEIVAVSGPAVLETNPFWAYIWYKYGFVFINALYQLTGFVLYVGAYNFAFKRNIFLQLGGYRTYLNAGGDEFDPLLRLKSVGKVVFNPQLSIHLSARRYRQGFLQSMVVNGLYHYLGNFALALLFKRSVIDLPAVRE